MKNIYGLTLEKLTEEMLSLEQKSFRAKQLFSWLYVKNATSFDEMSDISLKFREVLKEKYSIEKPKLFLKQKSIDGTTKLLLEMRDGEKIETVLMPYNYGNAICISTQVGCNMGCKFCASGLLKRKRNLSTEELVGQVLILNDVLRENNQSPVTHVVVMGTGEPFDNYYKFTIWISYRSKAYNRFNIWNCSRNFKIWKRRITNKSSCFSSRSYKPITRYHNAYKQSLSFGTIDSSNRSVWKR